MVEGISGIRYPNYVYPAGISAPMTTPQSFKSNGTTLERIPEQDTVVIQKPKEKGLSKGTKWAVGIGGALTALVAAGILIHKRDISKIKTLYKDKLVFSELGEKLEFKEAATVEEGIKFAKEVLKIPEVDNTFTLDAINTVNKGLVDVSNAYKGKLFMPRALRYENMHSSCNNIY